MKAMKWLAMTAVALTSTGCAVYQPASLSPYPSLRAGQDAAVVDPVLAERYPSDAETSVRYPKGASVPAPRPASHAWRLERKNAWRLNPREREAEKKSIVRDMPHAVVSPWGTVSN